MIHVCCTFQHSLDLELLLKDLERKAGVYKEHLFIAPLDQQLGDQVETLKLIRGDGAGRFDWSLIMGTIGMLLGLIYGYILFWGPIFWALIGLVGGGFLGFLVDAWYHRRKGNKRKIDYHKRADVLLLIDGRGKDLQLLQSILWQYTPTGFAVVGTDHNKKD